MRKLDRYATPQFGIVIFIAYLDRTNTDNAKVVGFEKDLSQGQPVWQPGNALLRYLRCV